MYTKCWQIVKDDTTMTFEVCGQTANSNQFTNTVYGMQKAGMNVSCATPPVTNKTSSRDLIEIYGYTKEEGLQQRLMKHYRELTRASFNEED